MKKLVWTPDLVGKFWSGIAESPLAGVSFGKGSGALFLDIVAPSLPRGATILDFGAGDGDMIAMLIERGFRVAAYEPAEGREAAIKAKPFATSPNFMGVFDRPGGTLFDVVLMTEVIEHVLDADMQSTMAALKGFLKPGGLLVASTPNSENLDAASVYCPICDHVFHRWQHVHSWTPENLENHFASFGFSRKNMHRVDFTLSPEAHHFEMKYKDILARYNDLRTSHDRLQNDYVQLVKAKIPGFRHVVKIIKDALTAWKLIPPPPPEPAANPSIPPSGDLRTGNESTLIYIGTLSA